MATLTDTAYYARKGVWYGITGLVALMVLRFIWGVSLRWWLAAHPLPPPAPTVVFGVIPAVQFAKGVEQKNATYQLQTVSGTVPDLGTQAKVYFMPAFRANVLGLELAKSLAAKLGFASAPNLQGEQVYSWAREGVLPGTVAVNLVTGYFSLDTAWFRDSEISSARAPSEQEAISQAQNYLRNAGLLADDLAKGKTRVEFLKTGAGAFSPAISQSEANFARVHFFRGDVNSVSVVTPQEGQALVQVIVSGAKTGDKRIVGLTYKYSPVELDRNGTYPLRGTQVAWQQFQSGSGVVVRMVQNVPVVVRDIKLAYYDSDTPQGFFQPIYVFSGDNGFVGYISALDEKWIGK